MSCIKCGKKAEGTDVFCKECLEVMKHYPVKSDTKVQIPVRPESVERKPVKTKKEKTPEEQLAVLQRLVKLLIMLIVGLSVSLAITVGALVWQLSEPADETPQQTRNRNYTTSATADGT